MNDHRAGSFDQRVGLTRDRKLLVRGDGIYLDLAVRSSDPVDVRSLFVLLLIEGHAEISEIFHDLRADK